MSNVNVVVVSGNLTRDPELRQTHSGTPVCNFGIAYNKRRKNAEGEYVEEAHFFDVTVWGAYGELTARKLRKGDGATVQGSLAYQAWETDAGEKRSKTVIFADQIDSDGYFRAKDDENAPAAEPVADQAPAATAPADDDIPF